VFVLTSTTAGAGTRLVWGTIIGYALQTLVLAAMIRLSGLGLGSLRLRHRSGRWSSIYGAVLIMAAAQIVLALAIPIDQAFAARLDTGSVATLGYANRIVILATGFGAVVLARALLPVLAAAVAAGDLDLGARQARQWAWLLTIVGSLAAAIIWALAGWGVATIFERGAFTSRDSAAVAHLLRFGALQLPFYFGGLALVQWIAAKGRYSALLAIAAVALLSKLVMNFVLVPTLGLEGIMISTVVMYAVSFACQILVAARP
jgi:peptidoglycan biosynthesis protein MviN/MurJ (putative lipid II flippase)